MKIKVLSSKVSIEKDGKQKTFYRYFSPCRIQVFDKNGNDCGIQEKNIEVHFTKKASKKLPDEKVFAIIESVKPENIDLPYVYRVNVDEETGELVFPRIWVRDFDNYEKIPYKPKANTCEPIIDESSELIEEQETESTEIE